jgi:hypothetical protein
MNTQFPVFCRPFIRKLLQMSKKPENHPRLTRG